MNPNARFFFTRIFIGILTILSFGSTAEAVSNCDTALSRISKVAAQTAIKDHQDNACDGLKQGGIGVDKTKKLELRRLEVCEDGPVVSARVTVDVKCGTSDAAIVKINIEETVTASVSANLDTCMVANANVEAKGFVAQLGISVADLNSKLKAATEKEIKPYCKP
jgi:hypothetical protein